MMIPQKARYILIGAGIVLIASIIWFLQSIVAYILIALVFSLIGHPLVEVLNKIRIGRFRFPKGLSAAITLLLIWAVILGFFTFFIPIIAQQAQEISNIDVNVVTHQLEEPLQKIEKVFDKIPFAGDREVAFHEYFSEQLISLIQVSHVSNIFRFIAALFGNIFVAIFAISFIGFFFLKDDTLFTDSLILLVPNKYEHNIRHVLISAKNLLSRYFIGISLDVTIIIVLLTSGFSIAGLKFQHAIIIGIFGGIMNIIPYIGPVLGITFALSFSMVTHLEVDFFQETLPLLFYIGGIYLVIMIIDGILFQPLIYSSSVKAHPLEIFLVIMIGSQIAGIGGMILAIPTYTIIRVIAKEFFNNFKLVKKLTENI